MPKEKERSEFVISDVVPGKLNALVKNLMLQMGIDDPHEAVRRVNSEEWKVTCSFLELYQGKPKRFYSLTSCGTATGVIKLDLDPLYKKHKLEWLKVPEVIINRERADQGVIYRLKLIPYPAVKQSHQKGSLSVTLWWGESALETIDLNYNSPIDESREYLDHADISFTMTIKP
jgi:hypothetical protein